MQDNFYINNFYIYNFEKGRSHGLTCVDGWEVSTFWSTCSTLTTSEYSWQKFCISSQAIYCLSTNWADSVDNTQKTIWLILKLFENTLRKNWMNDNNKKYLMIQREKWERYDDKWRKGGTGKFTTPNELVSPTFPAKAESLKWW